MRNVILGNTFDVPGIAKFALGRYWRTLTPEQQTEYTGLFEQMVVKTYADRFSDYNGEQFKVTGSRPDGDGAIARIRAENDRRAGRAGVGGSDRFVVGAVVDIDGGSRRGSLGGGVDRVKILWVCTAEVLRVGVRADDEDVGRRLRKRRAIGR